MTVGDLQQGNTAIVKSFLGDLDTQSRFLEMATIYDCLYEYFGLPSIIVRLPGWHLAGFQLITSK